MLSDLRLPAIKSMWAKLAEQSDKEGWPAARYLRSHRGNRYLKVFNLQKIKSGFRLSILKSFDLSLTAFS